MSDHPQSDDDRKQSADQDALPQHTSEAGLGRDLDQIDLDAAREVGADPPGGLGLDLGGGGRYLGEDEADDGA